MVTSMEAARAYVLAVQLRHRERVGTAGPYGGCGSREGTRVANCPEGKGCKLLKWEAGRQGSSPSVCVSTDRPAPVLGASPCWLLSPAPAARAPSALAVPLPWPVSPSLVSFRAGSGVTASRGC